MSRRVFDLLTSVGGAIVVVVLLVAGGLLLWGHSFVTSNVHDQLAQQQIFFPVKGSPELASPKVGPFLNQYAGQQLVTGPQAQAYADHFIAVHLRELPYDGVYSKISAAALANPKDPQLAALKQTAFTGTTLRGLLLEAYAFSTIGAIMLWGAIVSFALAAVMSVLVGLGFWHAHRTSEEEQMLAKPKAVPASS